MKKQFKKFFLFNIGISASLLFVFGCGGDVDPAAPLPTDDCIDYIEERPTYVEPQWLSDIRELYESRSAEHDDYLYAYSPDIPGEFEYRILYDSKTNSKADSLSLIYYAPNGSYIHLNISPEYELLGINESLSCGGEDVDCDLHSSFTETGELTELIADGNFPENDERVAVYSSDDKQLISDNCETFGQDSFILYTRVLNLANYAFSDIGVTVEDMGISWGEKYKETSPASPLSTEIVIENDHNFVAGRCEDCGIAWTKYMYDTIKQYGDYFINNRTYLYEGQPSEYMGKRCLSANYQVEDENNITMSSYIAPLDEEYSRSCIMSVQMNASDVDKYDFTFQYLKHSDDIDADPSNDYISYCIFLNTDSEHLAEIFASKELFKKECLYLAKEYNSDTGYGQQIGQEIPEILFEQLWEEKEIFIVFIDNGMKWLDTSLEDAGISYTEVVDKEQTENTEKDNNKDNKNGKTSSGKTATIDILDSPQSQPGNSSNTGSSNSVSSESQNNQSDSSFEQPTSTQPTNNSGQAASNPTPSNPTVNTDNDSTDASSNVVYSQPTEVLPSNDNTSNTSDALFE